MEDRGDSSNESVQKIEVFITYISHPHAKRVGVTTSSSSTNEMRKHMKLYTVHQTDTGEVLCIAARTNSHAAQVFVTFFMARTGDAPGEFTVERGTPADYRNNLFVESVVERNVAGVIVRQTNGSMLFDPVIGE